MTLTRADKRGLGVSSAPEPQVLSRSGAKEAQGLCATAEEVPNNLCTRNPRICNFLSSDCWLTGCCAPCFGACCCNFTLLCCGFCPCITAPFYLRLDRIQASIHNQLGNINTPFSTQARLQNNRAIPSTASLSTSSLYRKHA